MAGIHEAASWQWQCFTDEDLPGELGFYEKISGDTLITPAGRKISGERFDFPSLEEFDLNTVLPRKINVSEKFVLTGSFFSGKEDKILLGFAYNWKWVLFFNGKMLLDARESGNSERPTMAKNHILELDVKKGKNRLLLVLYGSGAMEFACKLMGKREPLAFQYLPFVTFPDAEENAVSITFSGNAVSPAAVDYRIKGEVEWKRIYDDLGGQIRHDRKVHAVRLPDLLPGREYEYRAVLLDDKRIWEEIYSSIETFHTPVTEGEFSFVVTADLQNISTRRKFLEDLLGKKSPFSPDFFVFCGDLFWTSDFDLSVMDQFIVPYREITNNLLPLVMVRGNHEIYGKDSNRYFEYFTPPYPGREGYYMFRWGNVCFIVLDFCDDAPRMPAPSTRQYHDFEPYLEEEGKWLKNAVKHPMCQEARYRIVLAHGVPVGDSTSYMPENIRKVIDPFFAGKEPPVKIHLWLGGHTHRPMRSIPGENAFYCMLSPDEFVKKGVLPPDGMNYHFPVVVTGGPNSLFPENMQFTSIEVKVSEKGLLVKSHDRYQNEFDSFIILPDGSFGEIQRAEEYKKREY